MINSKAIEGLTPERFWFHLARIAEIPRSSGNEAGAREYVESVAKENNLTSKTDAVGNLIVQHPATKGLGNFSTIVLQGHLDMVCEKNAGTIHDFTKDPIQFVRSGNIMKAKETTAGFDNGVGVATMCMLMEDTSSHGMREYLFTVDEETGLTGVNGLPLDFITGNILINLDTEEEGKLYIGCAGGKQTKGTVQIEKEAVSHNHKRCQVMVSGLKGGHSGCDIHENRGNAVKILAQALSHLYDRTNARLSYIKGGDKHNAIPREAEAYIFVPEDKVDLAIELIRNVSEQLKKEYGEIEPVLSIELVLMEMEKNMEAHTFKPELQKALLEMLASMPHGVHKMSEVVPGLVETSTSLASIKHDDKEISILTSQRSSSKEGLEEICDAVKNVFDSSNFVSERSEGYPGWNPDLTSPLLQKAIVVYETQFKEKPEITAMHAGLECGVIGEKYPEMQMLSVGPTIKNPHSPDEQLLIDSVPRYLNFLTALLSDLK